MSQAEILDRAFDKAEKSTAGNPAKLFPMEEKVLRRVLRYSYKLHRIRMKMYKFGENEVHKVGFVRIGYPISE